MESRYMEVSIDKVSLICTISDLEHYKTIIDYMHVYKEDYKGKKKHYWKLKYCTKVLVKLDSKCDLLMCAGINHGSMYVRFEFNAAKLSPEGWEALHMVFTPIFEDGYKTAYENFRINYLEVAVDFEDVEFGKIYIIDNKTKEFNDNYKMKGSVYYGTKKSKRSLIIYDKAKQLKDVKGEILGHPLLRIESRLRLPQIKLKDLATIKNPFLPLRIFDINKQHLISLTPLWNAFQKRIQLEGLDAQSAYLSLKPIERQALDVRIYLLRHEWWDPKKAWELAISKFSILKPNDNLFYA